MKGRKNDHKEIPPLSLFFCLSVPSFAPSPILSSFVAPLFACGLCALLFALSFLSFSRFLSCFSLSRTPSFFFLSFFFLLSQLSLSLSLSLSHSPSLSPSLILSLSPSHSTCGLPPIGRISPTARPSAAPAATCLGVWPSTSLSLLPAAGCSRATSASSVLSTSACLPACSLTPAASYITTSE